MNNLQLVQMITNVKQRFSFSTKRKIATNEHGF